MTFVDSGAWVALFVEVDLHYSAANEWLANNSGRLVTSDYVVDEVLTLVNARYRRQTALQAVVSFGGAAHGRVSLPEGGRLWQGLGHLSVAQRQGTELHRLHKLCVDAAAGDHTRVRV